MARDSSASTKLWGPSEWFGCDVESSSSKERQSIAEDALKPIDEFNRICPYLSSVTRLEKKCSKKGGVCSVQLYSQNNDQVSLEGIKVAICPSRLVSRNVLREIAHKILGDQISPILVKEVPYSVSLTKTNKSGTPQAAGRIDWLLVDGDNPTRFCAVETQSVYMQGTSQDHTFRAFIESNGDMTMPPNTRRPDYKSSVPKRLAPQLESKAQHLRSTNRKTVVLVDEFVGSNMSTVQEVAVPEAYKDNPIKTEEHKLNTCEVVFAIVSLDGSSGLSVTNYLYCTIAAAKDALNAVSAMSHQEFEDTVRDLVAPTDKDGNPVPPRADKVFNL
ncbi:restriction endonuclease NotI [Mariprofundus micogutta]|uniref:Restriction endonuclease NotI n=1 Tax=Mariprofundus micogutta TaxID=1921010 RepID=A0A1L8CJP4_9PROT|nr:NotI family restriction endonuclease [Mariprofundus micogutta]GAV19110.1 restriction endonuclease NotI [Mariprofundus micogutta]